MTTHEATDERAASPIQGRCLCGRVRFEVERASRYWLCHCSKCRRSTGGPFAAAAICRLDAFRFVSGEDETTTYAADGGYATTFCRHCGSPAPLVREDEGWVVVSPGSLGPGYDRELVRHIFVGSKASWWSIDDDVPQFDGHAPD